MLRGLFIEDALRKRVTVHTMPEEVVGASKQGEKPASQ